MYLLLEMWKIRLRAYPLPQLLCPFFTFPSEKWGIRVFLDDQVVRTRYFHYCGLGQSLVWELRFYFRPLHTAAKRKENYKTVSRSYRSTRERADYCRLWSQWKQHTGSDVGVIQTFPGAVTPISWSCDPSILRMFQSESWQVTAFSLMSHMKTL